MERRAAVSRWMRRVSTPSIFLSFVISIFPNFYSLIFLKILALTHAGCEECPHLRYIYLLLIIYIQIFIFLYFIKILAQSKCNTHTVDAKTVHIFNNSFFCYFFISTFPTFLNSEKCYCCCNCSITRKDNWLCSTSRHTN